MAESSAPWPSPIGGSTGTPMTAARSRAIYGAGFGDGVIEDIGRAGLAVSLVSSGTVARLAPGAALLRGTHRYGNTAAIDINIPTVSGTGNSRIDTLVVHYDPTQTTAATAIQAKVITGTPGAVPTAPTLTRAEGSGWMMPVAQWTRATGQPATNLVDLRTWLGPGGPLVASRAALPSDAPLGSTATEIDGSRWWRQLVAGTLQWVSDSALASMYLADRITPADAGNARVTTLVPLTTQKLRGGMARVGSSAYRVAVPFTGDYRIDAQAKITIPQGSGNGYAQSMVRVNSGGNPVGGTLVAESWDYIPLGPSGGGSVSLSLFRGSVAMTAGSYIEWFLTVPANGFLRIEGDSALTSLSISANG